MGSFQLTPLFVLRFICGFFYIPHIVGKFSAKDASQGFFRAAGFKPVVAWWTAAMIIETIIAIMLILGIQLKIIGWISFAYLLIAAIANFKLSKKWLWHIGGSEYPVFWAICCAVVAALSP